VIGGAGVDYYTAGRLNTAGSPLGTLGVQLPMLEAGDCASSFTSATRAAELCTVDPSMVGRTSGCVSFLWRPGYASTTALSLTPCLFAWAAGYEIIFDPADDQLKLVVGGVNRASCSAITWSAGDLLRVTARYSSAGNQLSLSTATSGEIAGDSTTWGDPGVLATYLGSRAASVNCRPSGYGDFLSAAI
jgi:hypothetical protein